MASIYAGDGYESGDIFTGGEESDLSDPGFNGIDDHVSEPVSRVSRGLDKWHTPSRPAQKHRDTRFSSVVGISRSKGESSRKQSSTPDTSSTSSDVLGVLSDLTNSLNRLVDRLDKQETRLAAIEDKLSSTPSSSGSPDSQIKSKVPLPVRSEVRRMYKALCDDKEDFFGFDTNKGVSFNDAQNATVLKTLLKEVSASNPSYQASHIRAAAYTYYRTLCAEESLKRRGKLVGRNQSRRRKERATRKLQSRTDVLAKSSMPEKDKKKWQAVLTAEFMSSEESNSESENGVIIKKELPWRSERVSAMFTKLDAVVDDAKSTFAKRQTRQRVLVNEQSQRAVPSGKYPSWAFSLPQ